MTVRYRVLPAVFAALCCIRGASAFIGDDQGKITSAYGQSVRQGATPSTFVYERQGYRIAVEFEDSKSRLESWSKLNGNRLTEQEIDALLKVQAAGKDWIEAPAHAGERYWTRIGANANYLPEEKVPMFSVISAEAGPQIKLPAPAPRDRSATLASRATPAAEASNSPTSPSSPGSQTSPASTGDGPAPSGSSRRTVSVRCNHTTIKGTQCLRMTTSPNGMCHQHGGD